MSLFKKRKLGDAPQEKAQRKFTDREQPQATFANALNTINTIENSKVIAFYGVGGIGKSSLQKHLMSAHLDPNKDAIYASVDFEDKNMRRAAQTYRVLADKYTKNFKVPFTVFNLAYTIYLSKENPNLEVKKETLPYLEEGELAISFLQFISETGGMIGSLVASLTKYGFKKIQTLRLDKNVQKELIHLQTLTAPEIEKELPLYFAYDLKLYKEKNPNTKIVVFIDTYEALWEHDRREANKLSEDEWVREFITNTENTLFVICGREKLKWEEENQEWSTVLDQHIIGNLSDQDAREFLHSCFIRNSAIADSIITSSRGNPFYLDLCVDLYERIVAENKTVTASDFQAINQHEITQRFIRYLSDEELDILEALSNANFFDNTTFSVLLGAFGINHNDKIREKITNNFSFIHSETCPHVEKNKYFMHALMREALYNKQSDAHKAQAHQSLFDHYNAHFEDIEDKKSLPFISDAVNEAFFHKHALVKDDISALLSWYQPVYDALEQRAQYKDLMHTSQQYRALCEAAVGENHPDTATSYNNLAVLYQNMGEYDKALRLYEKAKAICKATPDENHLATATCYNNLGELYRVTGKYDKALPLCEEALAIRKAKLSTNHADIASSYDNLAKLYQIMNRLDKAQHLYEEAVAIYEATQNEKHPSAATSYNNLAELYSAKGTYDNAMHLHKKALAIREATLGANHPDTAFSYNNLAVLYRIRGEYDKALELNEKALAIRETMLGENHSDTVTSYNNLAMLYKDMGEHDKALPLYKKALAIFEATLGENHPNTATSYNNLAGLYKAKDEYDKALPLYEKALAIRKAALGENNISTSASYNNLAVLYKAKGEDKKALPLYEKALTICKATLGESHISTAACYNNLAEIYQDMGEYDKALPLYEKALAICEATLGKHHPNTAVIYNNLAGLYMAMGE